MGSYLTEQRLGVFLDSHFGGIEILKNCRVVGSNSKGRPDFQIIVKKIIVEFDGYNHYNNSKTIMRDYLKDEIYTKLGYTVIRIPYFVQLSNVTVLKLFGSLKFINQTFPHGFIDNKALLPADFNDLGVERFLNDLKKFEYIREDIIKSLLNKIDLIGVECVLPKRLNFLIQ